ncbi:stability determinant [Pseudoduganella sp. FT26W]|uniref:Stability determinant n=1 Tax=Duganella aquatilis TaxID=2666082 RepID=A0A844D099_9BURK|nr:stability determinant [Duganella aquatilis]MRW83215.1 stability determinant [Duganella aquatilis]
MSSLPTSDHDGFATAEEAEAYDRWYRSKVQKSLDDPRPGIPHDVVMAEIMAIIEAKIEAQRKAAHASRDLEPRS